ncbi:crossover junction endodeoxyribonuclease RuvC [Pseudobacteriovorax antillogorgiicola]|uniref:Crossover junction endodeoxyribonuclease RuvC n=1 Tax=Pseudobacteriovorax antillogorgiicola TaxID=1513793 RepID=A0A1Y6CNA8_9BACT|nr:crossover junction endodeoxyribonuclease RuvC [Pseudobacteriovorax antillogorgiicola]TCS44387.1 Holliday junction endonuclease RuvC [Pseudobacteriovorax antillogorgiicola]SMF79351.1 Holliday junction endonuclease RuvC [Pseudobacteriovorax antillogorgiicola]
MSGIILGIDPGSQITGFCVLRPGKHQNLRDFRVLDAGIIRPRRTLSHSERLGQIHEAIHQLTCQFQPSVCVIEKGYTGINHNSALRLGETRGAIIAAVQRERTPVVESTPTEVKKTVTGNGHASKEDISLSLKCLIGFDRGGLPFDVTDAVAIALSYGMKVGITERIERLNLNPRAEASPKIY